MLLNSKKSRQIFLCIYFFVNLGLASFYLDLWCTSNPVSRALPVLTYLEGDGIEIGKYKHLTYDKSQVGEKYYSDKAPLPTFAMIPIIAALRQIGLADFDELSGKRFPVYIWDTIRPGDGRERMFPPLIPVLFWGSFFCGALPFAVIGTLIFRSMDSQISSDKQSQSPVTFAMLSLFSSFLFVYSGTFFGHIMGATLLLVGYQNLKAGAYFRAGLGTGLAFLCEYTLALAVPVWALTLLLGTRRLKPVMSFIAGVFPGIIMSACYNLLTTGNLFRTLNAYHGHPAFREGLKSYYGFRLPSLEAVWGLSGSTYMGFLPYTPILLLCIFSILKWDWQRFRIGQLLTSHLGMFSLIFFFIISSFFTWWGGWSFGPRYLVAMVTLLVYEGSIYLFTKKTPNSWLYFVTVPGLVCMWLAKMTLAYNIPDKTSQNGVAPGTGVFFQFIFPQIEKGQFNSNNILTLGWDWDPFWAAVTWLLLFICTTTFLTGLHRRMSASRGQ